MSEDFDKDLDLEIRELKESNEKTPQNEKRPTNAIVQLYFRSTIGPGEKMEKLTIDPEIVIHELKITVGQVFGLDPEEFHLSINGRTCDRDDLLSNYDVVDGTEALIIPVSLAG